MNNETYDNWVKIKAHLEAVGKTDSSYYKRAVAIVEGKSDPLPNVPFVSDTTTTKD